jgi:hypothetical protein
MMLAPATTIVLVVSPSLNVDGRKAYSTWGQLFDGKVDGRFVVERSTTPFCDAARVLLAEGVRPEAAADAELRAKLLATCNGNYLAGSGLDDMSPVNAILEFVPVDYVLYAIRQKVDKRCFPGNPPLASWRDPKFLRAVADNFCGAVVIQDWSRSGARLGTLPAQYGNERRG